MGWRQALSLHGTFSPRPPCSMRRHRLPPSRIRARRMLATALDEDYAPIRMLLRKAPTAEMRRLLSVNYEACIEWDCVSALRGRVGVAPEPLDALALSVGLQRIARDVWAFAALVGTNYQSLWLLYGQ